MDDKSLVFSDICQKRMTPLERFWSYVDRISCAPCWVWTGPKFVRGYGQLNTGRLKLKAHRFSWEHFNGRPIPDGLVVCHSCDNPSCVNPNHLRADTQASNNHDAIKRERWKPNVGTKNGRARVTPEQVRELRESRDTQMALAARYGIAQTQVSRIKRGECWASI